MTGRYKAYPEYKDSGVEWLELLPSSWKIMKVKFLLKDGAEGIKIGPFGSALKLEDMVNKGVKVYGQENVIKRDFTLGKRFISQAKYSDMQVYTAEQGDILVTMMGTSGKCQVVPESAELGIIDSHLLKLRTNDKILPELFRLLVDETKEVKDQIGKQGKGSIMHGLNSTIVKELEFPLPSLKEQSQILNFLDHETAKIDNLITKQEKLIELLKEKRQAVISHAVTKGLNPDAPMKDSGVEWLGEVPEHWSVIRLRFLCDITTGSRDTQDAKENGQYPFFVRSEKVQSIDTYSFEGEGVMTSGDGAGVGKIYHHFIGKCEIHQRVYLFHNFKHITPRYFYYFLKQNLEPVALAQSAKSTVDSLRLPILQEFRMCFGDESEQKVICEYVDSLSEKYDGLIDGANKAIELMKERKIALISAAVTGKIDVRDWQESA
ncbi:restriction endonuclease subunit S [Vibrio parahaemolyticus]|nr:restriction endonuclease subunit S [Vibrio parahaemolyticus]EJG1201834.1 restriction endonuclease subunit S [Vibrio parahaemolyticus]